MLSEGSARSGTDMEEEEGKGGEEGADIGQSSVAKMRIKAGCRLLRFR